MALATLSVDLVARLAQFQQGLDQAGRLAEAKAGTISRAFDGIKGAGLAIGGALTAAFSAGGAVAAFVQRVNAPILAMKDLSEATGAAFENISALEDVARNAGVSFDVVGGALVKFNQQLSAADSAAAPISVALRRIGLDAQELRRQDPAVALRQVAQALAGFADDGEKARLVQELFGKSVREAAPFLKDLAEATEFAGKVTAQQAEEADKLDKAIARLKSTTEDAARSIASVLVPALNSLFDRFREGGVTAVIGFDRLDTLLAEAQVIANAQASIGLRIERFAAFERQGVRGAAEELEKLRAEAAELARKSTRVSEEIKRAVNGGALAEEYSNEGRSRAVGRVLGPRIRTAPPPPPGPRGAEGQVRVSLTPEQATLAEALRRLENTDQAKLQGLRAQLEALTRLVQGGAQIEGGVFATIADEIARLDPEGRAAAERLERINALLAETPSAKIAQAAADVKLLLDAAADARTPEAFVALNEALDQAFAKLGELPTLLEPATTQLSEFALQAGRNIQDALGDTLEQALQGNFSSIGRLWVTTLQRMAAQAAAARLNELIFGNIFSAKGGSLGPWGQAIAGFFTGARADGGPVDAGGTYLVGERGPEILTMGARAGFITSAERLRMAGGMAGGGGLTYAPQVVIQGDVGPGTVRLVEAALARERARASRMAYAGAV